MISESKVKRFCKDNLALIENYEQAMADTTQTWCCHHRLELTLDDDFAHSRAELIRLDMYFNRPYFELIFLTPSEHMIMHHKGENNPLYGKHHSAETREKIGTAHKGKPSHMKGKPMSADTKSKISEALKGKPSPMKGKHHRAETRVKIAEGVRKYLEKR